MVSAFVCEVLGFSLRLTEAQLATVNAYRATQDREPLEHSPGIRTLKYGEHKEGYWCHEDFMAQLHDVLDVYEALFPFHQVIGETDWSSGHSKGKEGALRANNMNATLGGKQAFLHDSRVTEACLGPKPAILKLPSNEVIDCKLKAGEVQTFVWPSDPGKLRPFDDVDATVADFAGKAKGLRQVLWERGLYEEKMSLPDMRKVMATSADFMAETTAFEDEMAARGHIGLLSPKAHPELAGVGIENCWGKAKLAFRRANDGDTKTFHARILAALSETVLYLDRVRKFARRTRDYRRVYESKEPVGGKVDVEKLRKLHKTHRSALDSDLSFLQRS